MGRLDTSEARPLIDRESRIWIERLHGIGPERDAALTQLHALLLRAARFEVSRRRATSPHLRGGDSDDLAQQSADDALVAILRKLGDFRGESRFTTWAYKFALYEAAANVRKRAWQGREIPLKAESWPLIADDHQRTPHEGVESSELLAVLGEGIEQELSPHQREVLVGPKRSSARAFSRSAPPTKSYSTASKASSARLPHLDSTLARSCLAVYA